MTAEGIRNNQPTLGDKHANCAIQMGTPQMPPELGQRGRLPVWKCSSSARGESVRSQALGGRGGRSANQGNRRTEGRGKALQFPLSVKRRPSLGISKFRLPGIHSCVHMHIYRETHIYMHTHMCDMHRQTHMHTHTYTLIETHRHTQTNTHRHMQTHTHVYTYMCSTHTQTHTYA